MAGFIFALQKAKLQIQPNDGGSINLSQEKWHPFKKDVLVCIIIV